jgi:hypothetical protein
MKDSTHYAIKKWFLIGVGVRAVLAVVVFLMALRNFEALMLYLADLPTMLFLALAEMALPDSLFKVLAGGDPFYIPMNLAGCLLWGGIFTLIPFTRSLLFRLRRNHQTANTNP